MKDANILYVNDTLSALQNLAKHHRSRFDIPVIGITGSNGKTVVKEWLYQLLHDSKNITRSPRSYNSQIGVPLSVWDLNRSTELGIFEAGISEINEMKKIADIIHPTIGILTNIGEPHQENFSSVQQKLLEKAELFKDVDIIIYNADDININNMMEDMCLSMREIAWSKKDPNKQIYISKVEKGDYSTKIHYHYLGFEDEFMIPFIEEASIENALQCLAVMLYLNIPLGTIAERMAKLEPVAMRLEVKEGRNDCLLINDTYNSDINSLDIALDFQMRRSSVTKNNTLILSDILQTGLLPKTLYKKVADLCKRKNVNKIIGIGPEICEFKSYFQIEGEFYKNIDDFIKKFNIDKYHNEFILIKGARSYHFEKISELLELKQHETILEVNLDAITHNYNTYKKLLKPSTKIVCMVKAFGYGAGSYELAKSLQDLGCDYLAVALADEGADLRKQGITIPIIVMNPEFSTFRTLFTYNLQPEIYSFKILKAFIREAEKYGITNYPIHIKIDSGMHRLGFQEDMIDELVEFLSSQTTVMPRSVFSHLAGSGDRCLEEYTRTQIRVFKECAAKIQKNYKHKIIRHILNTAGIECFPEDQMEMVRLGIGLYGYEGSYKKIGLRNVSTLKSTILQINNLKAGETVGYSRKGVLERDSKIAIIPVGYADGYNRHLGNGNCYVLINGVKCPTVGNICMDVTLIDVTDCECKEGDSVVVFGDDLPLEFIAEKLDTITYEIISTISSRVKRVYFRE